MNAQVLEVKNKSRHWMMWAVLAIIVAFLAYTNIDTLKPAARKAYDKLSVTVSSFEPAKSAKTAYDKLSVAVSSVVPAESANVTEDKTRCTAAALSCLNRQAPEHIPSMRRQQSPSILHAAHSPR